MVDGDGDHKKTLHNVLYKSVKYAEISEDNQMPPSLKLIRGFLSPTSYRYFWLSKDYFIQKQSRHQFGYMCWVKSHVLLFFLLMQKVEIVCLLADG